MDYVDFLKSLDARLKKYFDAHKDFIYCKLGCSECCENGDYPISQIELEYLMLGFSQLNYETKQIVQTNFKKLKLGGTCPFLINHKCSIYKYRPIICRVHGLAYLCKKELVKIPFCVNNGKNYSQVYNNGEIIINPILENLDTPELLKNLEYGEIRNLVDWISPSLGQ